MTVKIAIAGASGRMGQALLLAAAESAAASRSDYSLTVTAASVRAGTPEKQPQNLPAGIKPVSDLGTVAGDFDVLIDFTTPEATMAHLGLCKQHGKAIVIGTTGLNQEQLATIKDAAADIPVLYAPNMSLGMNLCLQLLQQAAATLGSTADIAISETHHKNKKDSPSGTALKMREVIAADQGRDPAAINISSTRHGNTTGEHSTTFTTPGERITITHQALDRKVFAHGALHAACWLNAHPPGFYSMQDVLSKS